MTKRIVFAGVAGGVVMFIWTSIAHLALPLGQTGVSEIPGEAALLAGMQNTLGARPGLYLFPAMGTGPDAMQQYGKKLAAQPSGLLVYHPPGAVPMSSGQLVTEFAAELAEAFLLVLLLATTRLAAFGARVAFAAGFGLAAAITTNVSYWNWYGFPGSYTLANMTMQVAAYVLAGVVAAWLLPAPAARSARAAT